MEVLNKDRIIVTDSENELKGILKGAYKMNQEEVEKTVNNVKTSFTIEECKKKRSLKIANGKALCELDNRKGASAFLVLQNEKYIEGLIDSNTLVKNVINHYNEEVKGN